MIDASTIDRHKLAYHPDRVNTWLSTGDTTPIYIEVSPSVRCNLKCRFCAYGNADRKVDIKSEYLLWAAYRDNVIPYMKELGIRSVMYGGEGEPTLNKYLSDMIMGTTSLGIDTALTTNGTTLWEHRTDLSYLTWVKVSLDAGNSTTYEIVKGADRFEDVVEQIAAVCAIEYVHRSWGDIPCTIGVQLLLLPENYEEVSVLAKLCKAIGADYLVIKPYTPHDYTHTPYDSIEYSDMVGSVKSQIAGIDYNVIYRENAFHGVSGDIEYHRCLALPYWLYISANGDVYPCFSYYGHEECVIGSIMTTSILDIWNSPTRLEVYGRINSDMSMCRRACRMDSCNKYLQSLLDSGVTSIDIPVGDLPQHVNFI